MLSLRRLLWEYRSVMKHLFLFLLVAAALCLAGCGTIGGPPVQGPMQPLGGPDTSVTP